ncbi:hypothetical protein [Halalkalirubrum salinum]|uniref:hypothetical protein n=1 Tax=Halalkalirubrum salinum TaxID=2563889 RepID=UPI00148534E1|nr:hypothetical protein [Halalkalirubrum salinum]
MLGLQFFTCDRCGLVHADVDNPPRCGRCDHTRLTDITASTAAEPYFTDAIADRR